MGRRHLLELLREEQEPFVLETFIHDKRSQLQKPAAAASTANADNPQLRRRQRTSQNHAFSPSAICKSPSSFIPCRDSVEYLRKGGPLSPFRGSTDSRKSPMLDLPGKSPSSATGSRITAALLLEAAMRIHRHHHHNQRQQQQKKKKGKKKKKKDDKDKSRSSSSAKTQGGFGFLFSILKRLLVRKPQHKEILDNEQSSRVSVRDILNWNSGVPERKSHCLEQAQLLDEGVSDRSLNINADVRSEEEWKGFVLESSTLQCGILDDVPSSSPRGAALLIQEDYGAGESIFGFSSSPSRYPSASSSSPSTSSPSFSGRTPYFEYPPATSPVRRRTERQLVEVVVGSTSSGGLGLLQEEARKVVVEEEKDQFSPVSVLDPPFDKDHHRLHDEEEEEEEEEQEQGTEVVHVHDFQESFATVQRCRKQILNKIRRFERLAGLDPVDLEKRITADDEDDDDDEASSGTSHNHDYEEDDDDDDCDHVYVAENATAKVPLPFEIEDVCNFVRSNADRRAGDGRCCDREIPSDVRRLVVDLVEEEEEERGLIDAEEVAAKVRQRFEEWKEVESNTIDMMVEMDLRRVWWTARNLREHVMEVAVGIEASVLSVLLEEVSGDLCCICRKWA